MSCCKSKLLTAICLTITLFISCGEEYTEPAADSWVAVEAQGEGTILLNYVPSDGFSYDDEEGNTTGVTIELMRDFVSFVESQYEVNLSLKLNPIERFFDFYQTVVDGVPGEFGVANVTITEERRNELAFSPLYMKNIAVLITHSNVDEIDDLNEISDAFSGLNGLAFESTLHETRISEIISRWLPEAGMEYAHSNNEIIERTSAGNHYFSYVDIYNYWRASEQGAELTRHSAGDDPGEQFGVIMPLNTDWQELINEFFEHDGGYLYSNRYRQIMETHLGPELAELLLDAL